MSGTSADGLDAALVDFISPQPKLILAQSSSIPDNLKQEIHNLSISSANEIDQIKSVDQEIAFLSALAVKQLCTDAHIKPEDICAIGSHGQTIRHYPTKPQALGYSLQVGDPNIIAEQTGITTVADFRRRDIAAGGHGAPLAPAFHKTVFHSQDSDRIILNLGGIANITYIPKQGNVLGYDTGPANTLMDAWCQQHCQLAFDRDGTWANSGVADTQLLSKLLEHSYLRLEAPKSTGREDFHLPWLTEQLTHLPPLKPVDVQATLLAFTAETIATEIEKQDPEKQAEIYTCGGGSHNNVLMTQLLEKLSPRKVAPTAELGIHPDWVEAMAFAWLAKQTMEKAAGNLPEVTGADKAVILGGIYLANS